MSETNHDLSFTLADEEAPKTFARYIMGKLTKPLFLSLVPEEERIYQISPMQVVIRVIAGFIAASWFSFFPFYLLIIYMHHNHFFSYDFFVDGVFGMNTFIISSVILVGMLSFYFYGFVVLAKLGVIQQKRENKNQYRLLTWLFFGVSLFIHYYFWLLALSVNKPMLIIWFISISAMVCCVLFLYAGNTIKKNIQRWQPIVFLMAFTMIMPFFHQDATAQIVNIGLRSFNVGGDKEVTIIQSQMNKLETMEIKGKLILLTPSNAYLRDESGNLKIVPISEQSQTIIHGS